MNATSTTVRALALAAVLAAPAAHADWTLLGEHSVVSFVSVKNAAIAETHTFDAVDGRVTEDGAQVAVDLASVDTLIPIRDERMRELFFEVAEFPEAVFRTDADLAAIDALAPGETRELELDGTLELHGESEQVRVRVLVARLGEARAAVTTVKPFVVSADAYGLGPGLERLREIAGLNSITPMVPVSLALIFARDGAPD